jgi:hypothetical protein
MEILSLFLTKHHKPYGDSRGMDAWQLRELSGLRQSWLIYPCGYSPMDRRLCNVQCSEEEKSLLDVPGIEPTVHSVLIDWQLGPRPYSPHAPRP